MLHARVGRPGKTLTKTVLRTIAQSSENGKGVSQRENIVLLSARLRAIISRDAKASGQAFSLQVPVISVSVHLRRAADPTPRSSRISNQCARCRPEA